MLFNELRLVSYCILLLMYIKYFNGINQKTFNAVNKISLWMKIEMHKAQKKCYCILCVFIKKKTTLIIV